MGKRGFTLIELLVVIAIIGILASIISVGLQSSKAKGRDARRIADIKSIQLALETYYNDNQKYPNNIYGAGGFEGTYMSKVPLDPKDNSTQYVYTASYPSSGSAAVCSFYHLGAPLEDTTNGALSQDNDLLFADANNNACTPNTGHSKFDGNSPTCTGGSGSGVSPDPCYDVTP